LSLPFRLSLGGGDGWEAARGRVLVDARDFMVKVPIAAYLAIAAWAYMLGPYMAFSYLPAAVHCFTETHSLSRRGGFRDHTTALRVRADWLPEYPVGEV